MYFFAHFSGDAEDGIVSLAVQYLYERVHNGATGAVHDLKWVPSSHSMERVKHKLHRICQPHRQVAWWRCLHCCKRKTSGDVYEPSVRMAGALRSPALPFLRLCWHTQVLPLSRNANT